MKYPALFFVFAQHHLMYDTFEISSILPGMFINVTHLWPALLTLLKTFIDNFVQIKLIRERGVGNFFVDWEHLRAAFTTFHF